MTHFRWQMFVLMVGNKLMNDNVYIIRIICINCIFFILVLSDYITGFGAVSNIPLQIFVLVLIFPLLLMWLLQLQLSVFASLNNVLMSFTLLLK